jgi:alpha-glucosidase (family GH31 glycosyl hydrolase)
VDNVHAEFSVLGAGISRSTFRDKDNEKRWDVAKVPGMMGDKDVDVLTMMDGVGFSIPENNPDNFGFVYKDPVSKTSLFDTSRRSFIYTDKYLEMGFVIPSQTLFGLGQHNSKFLLSEGDWTMFNRDQPGSPVAEGEGKQHLYGTHPFLMFKTNDNKFGGILFYNSNPQQVSIEFSSSGKSLVHFKSIGGIFDIFYFMGDSADGVIRKYNHVVGKPDLPPFWALGFHQCSWQYNTTQDLKDAVNNYTSNGYIFDTIWTDIMYMDRYIDFTLDNENFTGLLDYVNELHGENRHFVPIVDAGISIIPPASGPNWYKVGEDAKVFIKSTQNPDNDYDGNLIGQVWPGYTAFVDFLHPGAQEYWSKGLKALDDLIKFDGLWLDMNEPSNFCVDDSGKSIGECYPEKEQSEIETERRNLVSDSPIQPGEFDKIPFTPGQGELYNKTLSMDGYFHDDNENGTFVMYNIHNMYGTLETIASYNYLKSRDNRRSLIISRDSFVGHGKYGSIWTGDNDASQEHMQLSINQIMNFNQFGMPFVGGDICGFGGETTPTLCARWAQVGAFYPFMRNHYAINKKRQEFYTFDDKYQEGMKESIRVRYSILRYMYTQLYKSSRDGDPMIRHPMYQWPNEDKMVKNENSFLIGPSIRVTANFDIAETPADFSAPFAKGRYLELRSYNVFEVSKGVQNIKLYNGWDYPNVHVLGGSIVPIQDTGMGSGIEKSHDLLKKQMKLLVFPTNSGYAKGEIFIANGEEKPEKEQFFTMIHTKGAIQIQMNEGVPDEGADVNEVIEEIHIVGTDNVDKVNFACYMDKNQKVHQLSIEKASNGDAEYIRIFGGANIVTFDQTDSIFYGVSGEDYNYCNKAYITAKKSSSDKKAEYTLSKGDGENSDITLTLNLLGENTVEMQITSGKDRFIVPDSALNPKSFLKSQNSDNKLSDFVQVSKDNEKFSLTLHSFQDPENVYFKIDEDSLVFSDYFLSMETEISTNQKIYGMGERVTEEFFLTEGTYTTWAKDQTDPLDDGKRPSKNIYGAHPVYFTRQKANDGFHYGVFNFNANAQDTKIEFNDDLGAKISHYIAGTGIFDMYFFLDNKSPEDVVTKYHDIIGPTLLPPFWGMGWHQCKYGYNSTDSLRYVYDNYNSHDFPMDVLWSDIDHMLKYRDFTYDEEGVYAGLPDLITELHKDHRKYVPIVDAGVAIVRDGSYPVFDEGLKKDVFIKSGNEERTKGKDPIDGMKGVLYGKVWPGYAAFPDFTKTAAHDWWLKSIRDFHDKIEFDGLWLDMNEVANFCTGPCIPDDVVDPEKSVKSKLVYQPGGGDLEEKCLSIDGKHEDGLELDYHSLFGFLQGVATNKYFKEEGVRPFIISRSTFAGQGKYTSHWNGDNHSFWPYLKYSISGVMNMNLYGINFNGADICGFLEETTPELCQKWTNVGAFYPFARNHDDIGNAGQEPYQFSDEIQTTMRNAIRWRYALLRYFYTQLNHNHVYGGMFWKPLFFEFPNEDLTYTNIERNVMIGSAVKLSPMLDEGDIKKQDFIFPKGTWCDIVDYTCFVMSQTGTHSLTTMPENLNLHLRMGQIIPLQRNAISAKVMNTEDLNNLPMGLMINIDTDTKIAVGTFFADDGNKDDSAEKTLIQLEYVFNGEQASLAFGQVHNSYKADYTQLTSIEIVGAKGAGVDKLLKLSIDGGEPITGTHDRTRDFVAFEIDQVVDMTQIKEIIFS